jgi:SAM-dependent methyltransferase
MSENWFGADVAATYDQDTASRSGPEVLEPMLDVLFEIAAGGSALEFAIGTGRVAIPLAARGVPVSGIELSAPMLARMRDKAGGTESAIPVVVGDMATSRAPGAGTFSLVYLVFNTVANLTTQDAQVQCFRNAAAHLVPGGHFVVEVGVPALVRLASGERYVVFERSDSHVGIDEYEVATQRQWSHPSATSGLPSSISWPGSRACAWSIAGATGTARRSPAKARSTSRSGRRTTGLSDRRLTAGRWWR